MAGARYDLSLSWLDRQMLDKDGYAAGKVDDLELAWEEGSPPYVTAILSGHGALSRRVGGRLGRVMEALRRRFGSPSGSARVSFGVVTALDDAVHLSVSRADLPVAGGDDWARTHLVDKIPGAAREAE